MGQKVNPHGLRVGVIKNWDSVWYADGKDFADNLVEDNKIRNYLKKRLYDSGRRSRSTPAGTERNTGYARPEAGRHSGHL